MAADTRSMMTSEVAEVLAVSEATLCQWRLDGHGPLELQLALVVRGPRIYRYRCHLVERLLVEEVA